MKDMLMDLGFDFEDIDSIIKCLESYGIYQIEKIVYLLKRYGCSKFG